MPPATTRTIPLRYLLAALGASALAVVLLMKHAGLSVSFEPGLDAFVLIGGPAVVGILYRMRDPVHRVHRFCRDYLEHVSLFAALCVLGALASYPVAAISTGFVDAPLAAVDRALHFDWLGWYGFVAAHPLVQPIERAVYETIYVTPAILFAHFAATGEREQARRFIATFWLAAVLTLVLFAWLPCRGPLATAGYVLPPYMPESALYQAQQIVALRAHGMNEVALGALRGLVGAPSFHSVSAVLYIATAWPIRRLRWPLLGINVAMLATTPVEGTHYLADMLIGAAVAGIALAAVRLAVEWPRLAPRRGRALLPAG